MLRTGHLLGPASTQASRPTPEASLPGTLASPRTGLAPAGCRELVARPRHVINYSFQRHSRPSCWTHPEQLPTVHKPTNTSDPRAKRTLATTGHHDGNAASGRWRDREGHGRRRARGDRRGGKGEERRGVRAARAGHLAVPGPRWSPAGGGFGRDGPGPGAGPGRSGRSCRAYCGGPARSVTDAVCCRPLVSV